MRTPTQNTTQRHGTRWRRSLVPVVVGAALTAGMATATMSSALGFNATVTIMNTNANTDLNGMSFSTSGLVANDAGFGMAPVKTQNGAWKNVLRAGFAGATLQGLCLTKTESLGLLGNYTIKLYAPSSTAITASNGVFDLTDLVGDTTDLGINLKGSTQIGLSTADITTVSATGGTGPPYDAMPFGEVPSGNSPLDTFDASLYTPSSNLGNWVVDGKPHTFGGGWTGIDAGSAVLGKSAGRLWQVQLSGNITLPNLQITVTPGTAERCASWPTEANFTNTYYDFDPGAGVRYYP